MPSIREAISLFHIDGNILDYHRYGNGHINDTYLVVTDKEKYIFQRINHLVFSNVERLMHNQELVTKYLAERLKKLGNYDNRLLLNIVYTNNKKSYIYYDKKYYRCYQFIEGGQCLEKIHNPYEFELSGIAFGRFQKLLSGFDANKLYDIIPNFHNTKERFQQLLNAIDKDTMGRAKNCQDIIAEFLQRKHYCSKIVDALESGEIPIRVTHNDTKLNNVLIDIEQDKPLAVLDLDTVMSGSIVYDFGDSIRYGANTGVEDERDLNKVNFSMELFKAFCRGFIGEVKDILTKTEIENLAFGAILMTYECGMRFITDYLNGDTYFKISRQNHNLDRAKTQLKMVVDMENSYNDMNKYIGEFYA